MPAPVVADRAGRAAAASCSAARTASPRPGAGVSSITFWCRRCSEQSRSPSAHTVPCASASTCTSTCRAPSAYGSTKTSPSPKAAAASARAAASSASSAAEFADHPHAAPAAARGRLHQQRQVGGRHRRRVERREQRHPGGRHQLLGPGLGPHRLDGLAAAARSTPAPRPRTARANSRVLGQEPVPRVHRVRARRQRRRHQQVGRADRCRRARRPAAARPRRPPARAARPRRRRSTPPPWRCPASRQVRKTRRAISPRLATSTTDRPRSVGTVDVPRRPRQPLESVIG